MGRPKKYEGLYDRCDAWKKRSNFEASDHRKGYRAGRKQAKTGRSIPDISGRSIEYQTGYLQGYDRGKS